MSPGKTAGHRRERRGSGQGEILARAHPLKLRQDSLRVRIEAIFTALAEPDGKYSGEVFAEDEMLGDELPFVFRRIFNDLIASVKRGKLDLSKLSKQLYCGRTERSRSSKSVRIVRKRANLSSRKKNRLALFDFIDAHIQQLSVGASKREVATYSYCIGVWTELKAQWVEQQQPKGSDKRRIEYDYLNDQAFAAISFGNERIHRERVKLMDAIQNKLDKLEGVVLPSAKAKEEFAERFNEMAASFGCGVLCPCGRPATLKLAKRGDGNFQYRHYLHDLNTTHRGTLAIPRLILVPMKTIAVGELEQGR